MKHLKTYCEDAFATPGNTLGMGNPGEVAPGILSEPIGKIDCQEPAAKCKKQKKKKSKSLAESLFGNNITNDLPIESIAKHLRNKDIAKLSKTELIDILSTLYNSGEKYKSDEFKKHPVNTFKNVIIMRNGYSGEYVDNYIFIFNKHSQFEPKGWEYSARKVWLLKRTNYSWGIYDYRELDRREDWEDKVKYMNSTWLGNDPIYSVLPEKISQDLIKCIMGK